MAFRYLILGAGRQGAALAYDLARLDDTVAITLFDADEHASRGVVDRLRGLLPDAKCELTAATCDVSHPAAVTEAARGVDVVLSAVPYRFNVALTKAAIEAGASFCDLGGNTAVVREQLALHEQARARGVSVLPDCGLAPGLGNILAAHAVASLDEPEHVHVRCGGLPETPVGPLGYKLVFNFQGLVNEYSGVGEFLRDGKRIDVPTLTELEEIEFAPPVGKCEAAVTSGGTSTCPESFLGKLQSYDYKTVRYPGHFAIIRAMFELGCFEESLTTASGDQISPKPLIRQLFETRLTYPEVRDLVVLRVTATGRNNGQPTTLQYDLRDHHDYATGFTAMERTTAYPTALAAHMQARGLIEPGARPLELAVPLAKYVEELPGHGIQIAGIAT